MQKPPVNCFVNHLNNKEPIASLMFSMLSLEGIMVKNELRITFHEKLHACSTCAIPAANNVNPFVQFLSSKAL